MIEPLIDTVLANTGTPRDAWEVTAQLEVLGLRDTDARAAYEHKDLFTLGRAIFERARNVVEPDDPPKPHRPLLEFAKHYASGSIFAIPMLLQAGAILVWGYGLWGAIDVDVRTGTAIALGFIAAYVLTGGFVQAITRRGLFYHFQQEPALARWVVLRGWWIAARLVLGLLVPAFVFNVLYHLLPWDLFGIAALYYAALSILLLNWSMLYVAGRRYWIVLVTAVALAVVIIAAKRLGANVIVANTAGLATAAIASFAVGLRSVGQARSPVPGDGRDDRRGRLSYTVHNPPRLTVLVYSTSRAFLYGLLYNAFVFADRIVAWSALTRREDLPPYTFWLSPRYELGMDLALIVVMLLSGVVEAAVQTFSTSLVPVEKSNADLTQWFARFLRRRIAILVPSAIAAIATARVCVAIVARMPGENLRTGMTSQSAMIAFWLGACGYALLMLALQNLLILMTLSRAELAARSVAIALVVNLAVGFTCSRAIHYAAAAAGLTAGAAVLVLLTWRDVHRVGKRLDYYYFAAF
jgi:hypothetical protein